MARKIAAGNWKMNGLSASGDQLEDLMAVEAANAVEVVICPPATLLSLFSAQTAGSGVEIGGQDCHAAASGAHTGDIAAEMVADTGATYVIVGHSERRTDHGETNAVVAGKVTAGQRAGLTVILCLGETLQDREAGYTLAVVRQQLHGSLPDDADPTKLVIAYEPVWAIGTGLTPTNGQIAEVHADLRAALTDRIGAAAADVPLLYGGSVKAANAAEIFAVPDVDGALVGGASLKVTDFTPIVEALAAS